MSCVLNNGDPLQDHDILSDILHFVIAIVAVVGYPCPGMEMAIGLYRPLLIWPEGQIMGELTRLLYQEARLLFGGLKVVPVSL